MNETAKKQITIPSLPPIHGPMELPHLLLAYTYYRHLAAAGYIHKELLPDISKFLVNTAKEDLEQWEDILNQIDPVEKPEEVESKPKRQAKRSSKTA